MHERTLVLLWLAVGLVVAACSGGASSPADREADLRRDVERGFNAFLDGNFLDFQSSLAQECRGDFGAGEFALARGFFEAFAGEGTDLGVSVSGVEFLTDDRALVTAQLLSDGEPVDFFDDEDDGPALWVLQGGRWRSAEDCEEFEDEVAQALAGADEAREAERAETPGLTRENPVPLGESILLENEWEVAVLDARSGGTTDDGDERALIRIRATYRGFGSDSFPTFDIDAVGRSNVSRLSNCFLFDEGELPNAEVFTGGSIEGYVCLVVPRGDVSSLVVFFDPSFDDDDRRWFATR